MSGLNNDTGKDVDSIHIISESNTMLSRRGKQLSLSNNHCFFLLIKREK